MSLALFFAATCLVMPSAAEGQDLVIRYDHSPALPLSSAARFSYTPAGEGRSHIVPGLPRNFEVPQGGRVCLIVEHANPLFYRYALEAKEVKVENPEEMQTQVDGVIALIRTLLPAVQGNALGATGATPERFREYLQSMERLGSAYQQLEQRRLQSDNDTSFRAAYSVLTQLAQLASAAEVAAEKAYAAIPQQHRTPIGSYPAANDPAEETYPFVTDLLHTTQLKIKARVADIASELNKALAALPDANNPICSTVEYERSEMTIRIAAAGAKTPLARPVGDTIVNFTVDRVDAPERYAIVPGIAINHAFRGHRKFALTDGVVTGESAGFEPVFRPSAALLLRIGDTPLWTAAGGAVGDGGGDLFIGFATRGDAFATTFTIGFGYSYALYPSRLKAGAENEPLPPDVTDLDDNIEAERFSGLTLFFGISGVKF